MEKESQDSIELEPLKITNEIARQNMLRISLSTIFSLVVFIGLFIINFYSHFISKTDSTSLQIYIVPWLLTFLLNISLLIYMFKKRKTWYKINDESTLKIHKITIFYVWNMLFLSCWISILDLHYYNHLVIYLIYLIICSSVIIVHIRSTILPITICSLFIFSALMYESNLVIAHQFNLLLLVLLTVITLILSFFNFTTIHNSLLQQKLLIEEKIHSYELTEKLQLAAETDLLTGLANRRGYSAYIQTLQKKLPLRVTTLIFDIDSFKNYNDYYGHTYGDLVLSKVAECLHTLCHSTNHFAVRWGGEEFLVLLQNHTDEQILDFYNLFIESIASHNIRHELSTTSDHLTFSVGGNSQVILDLEELTNCIVEADYAQYLVKKSTKNDLVLATDGEITYITDAVKNDTKEKPFAK